MTHDPSNPFHKLAKDLAARAKQESGRADKSSRAPKRMKIGSEAPVDNGEETALFLDAVSRIQPLPAKKKRSGRGVPGTRSPHGQSGDASLMEQVFSSQLKEKNNHKPLPQNALHVPAQKLDRQEKPNAQTSAEADAVVKQEFLSVVMDKVFAATGKRSDMSLSESETTPEEAALFAKAMHGVAPVTVRGREVAGGGPGIHSGYRQTVRDPARALQDILDGKVQFALHHTDEFMEGFVVGVDPLVLARLRGGQYSPEKHLDLHGMNARQAYEALSYFIQHTYQRGMRCVVVVTGRGKNSPDGVGVLRPLLQQWFCRNPFKRVILAFCTAQARDGGPGAVYVLLRKYKKSCGKIIWEHTPSDEDFPDL